MFNFLGLGVVAYPLLVIQLGKKNFFYSSALSEVVF